MHCRLRRCPWYSENAMKTTTQKEVIKEKLQSILGKAEPVVALMQQNSLLAKAETEAKRAIDLIAQAVVQSIDGSETTFSKKITDLQNGIKRLEPEDIAAVAAQASGELGVRCYAKGQWLSILDKEMWRDAIVVHAGVEHRLRMEDGVETLLALHPWNHAPRELPQADFEALRVHYIDLLRKQHSHMIDALTGKRLDLMQQCVAVKVSSETDQVPVTEARSLSRWLRALHVQQLTGGNLELPTAVLLTAGPAAGKTTLISQVVALSLEGELVPVVIKMQQLQLQLLAARKAFESAWNWPDAFLRLQWGADSPYYRFLR